MPARSKGSTVRTAAVSLVSPSRHQRCHVLQVAIALRRHGRSGRFAPAACRAYLAAAGLTHLIGHRSSCLAEMLDNMVGSDSSSDYSSLIITDELDSRPSRQPNHEGEIRALRILARTMTAEPDQVLQRLVEEASRLTRSDSAGISLLDSTGEHSQFRWVAVAGAFANNLGGTIPFEASPSKIVLERNEVMLFRKVGRDFPALRGAQAEMQENLLVPLRSRTRPIGVLWAFHQTSDSRFDLEDVRILQSLSEFATAAHEMASAQAALRASEEQLETIFANAAVGLSEIAPDGRFLRANDELCRILGRSREEVLRLTAFDVTHPDDVAPSLAAIAESKRTDQPASLDKRYLRPDGTSVWANSRVRRLQHGPGQPGTQLAVTADLTERRAAEERVRDSEARLRLALDASRMGVWTYDPGADRFEFDDRAAAIGGVEPIGALPALSVMALFHPDDVGLVQARLVEALDPHGSGWNEAEVRFVHPDGSIHWAHARAQAVCDSDGQARWNIRLLGTLVDITDRKRAESALRESEARFRAVANLVPGFLWSSDLAGRATWLSERWFEYTGQSQENALGDGWQQVVHPEDREGTMESFVRIADEGIQYSHEYRLRGKDGTYRWFMVRAEPIKDASGHITQCYGAVTDIHEPHELQQRQAVMVDELQHRTRNLLTVVRSIAQQTMTRTGPTEQFREQFNDRLAALSRVQGLLSRSDQEPVTIRALIQTELDALAATSMRERVALEGPRIVLRKASVQTLALALHELATNARKYGALACEQGELRVSWDTYTAEAGEQRLSLTWLEEGISYLEEGSPIRRGYGRELIEKALPYALKARTSYKLGEAELRCSIDLPLTHGAEP
jgi:PAS domain S-box-containing protein